MKLLFFGSGEFGLPTLADLHARHQLLAVVTQPDRPAGRKRVLTPTPVGQWAQEQGLTVLKQQDVNEPAFVEQIQQFGAEASVVIAFGQKLSPALIDAMGRLAVNLHASLLPKYRGAAPINWAMIEGERVTGVSVIELAQRMDAGRVYATASLDIDPNETAGELHDRLAQLGPQAVGKTLNDLANDALQPGVQDESQATRATKLHKQDGTVSFDQPAEQIRQRVHGLTPWPGCRVTWRPVKGGDAKELFLRRVAVDEGTNSPAEQASPGEVLPGLHIATSAGLLRLVELQAPGTRVMSAEAFAAGHNLLPGDVLEPWTG